MRTELIHAFGEGWKQGTGTTRRTIRRQPGAAAPPNFDPARRAPVARRVPP
jgi:hypothetical protein